METASSIIVGPFVLRRDGLQLVAEHKALREPMAVSESQLQRWLMRQARESLVLDAKPPKVAA